MTKCGNFLCFLVQLRLKVCDPTIIPGKVGEIMETMKERPATLMMLRRESHHK